MLAITPRPPSLIKRVWDAVARPPAATPYREMGVSGTAIYSGYVQNRETSPKWSGAQRYVTISDMAVNTSIIAAGVHYFLNLIAHPQWTVAPADDSAEARAAADLVESALHGMEIPWSRVVRRAGTFRFYGFGVQEWTAKKRADGSVGLASVEPRPQATIERWVVADDGAVEGVWQRAPGTGALLGIPRKKFLYLVDDTLTDSPEGVGIFRHLAESWERLKVYYELEARAFERDLRGIPIGRVPYTLINQAVKDSQLTAAEAETLVRGMEDFVKLAVKKSDTSLTLDSMPYESQAADGRKVASVMQWGLELLQGSSSGVAELGAAITRTQYEMARVLTAEHLLMGESSGNRALSEDKSRNLYLVANSVLSDIAAGATTDIVARVCMLNGISEELYPRCEVEDVAFKDAESVAATLAKMAQAGAVLAPDDPVVEDVRSLMGVSAPSPVSPEMAGLPAKSPTDEEAEAEMADEEEVEKGWSRFIVYPGDLKVEAAKRFDPDQPRDDGGRWTSAGGGGSAGDYDLDAQFSGLTKVTRPITASERDAVETYVASSRTATIQDALREGRTPRGANADRIAGIDAAISKSITQRDFSSYRGVSAGAWDDFVGAASDSSVVRDPGFLSTSLDSGVIDRFTGEGGGKFIIQVPAGTPALAVTGRFKPRVYRAAGGRTYGTTGSVQTEREVLLSRGARLGVVYIDRARRQAILRVLPSVTKATADSGRETGEPEARIFQKWFDEASAAGYSVDDMLANIDAHEDALASKAGGSAELLVIEQLREWMAVNG